jgi:hypothetical protein
MVAPYANTLQNWARLGVDLRHKPAGVSFSSAFTALIGYARALREAEFRELGDTIAQSNARLSPLCEPLTQSIGLNRWLARAREEAYSDWLKWLFEQMNAGELINVLDLHELNPRDPELAQQSVHVVRERVVEQGHEGHQGRIDLILQLGQWAVVTVEVKKGDADTADTEKQLGYKDSIKGDLSFQDMKMAFILLVSGSTRKAVDGFEVRNYRVFCRNIRRLAINWMHCQRLFAAAITLMIGATIETNLLRLSVQRGSFTPATLCHLKEFAERDSYE